MVDRSIQRDDRTVLSFPKFLDPSAFRNALLLGLYGLFIAQSLSVWLLSNAYLSSPSGRMLVGMFVNMLVMTTSLIGVSITVGSKPPLDMLVSFLGGGTMVY
ncbi:MAG: hypothetical protein ACKN82_04205, partial [Pirellula sp.]